MASSITNPAGRPEDQTSQRRSRASGLGSLFDREQVDTWCERGILGCVLGILVFGPLATGATRMSQFLVLLGFAALLSVFWAVRLLVRDQYRFLWAPVCWAVIAFTGYTLWQYTRADIEFYARTELLQVLLYAFLFFAILDNLNRQETIQIILFTLIGLGMLNAFYAVYQFFTESQHILWFVKPVQYQGRGSGTYVCPNHLAGFLEMLIPVALAYTITGRLKPLSKVFLGYAALAMVAGVGVTLSRGGYAALGLALIVFFGILIFNRDYRIPAIAILVLLLAVGSFFGYRSIQAAMRIKEADGQHLWMRRYYWQPAIEMWKEDKLFGVGPNHYDWRLRKWRHWQLQGRPLYAHNDYVNTLADYGLVGSSIVLAALGLLGWGVARTWKFVRRSNEISSKPSNRSAVVLGCSAGFLAILFHSTVDFNMHIPANAALAVALMAILTSHLRFATERFWFNPGTMGRIFGSLAVLAVGAVFAWQTARLGAQTYVAGQPEPPKTFQEQIERLTRAYSFDPKNADLALEIGETIRKKAWEGNVGYEELLRQAIPWLEKSIELNRWNPYGYTNLGMCYHWLNEPEKAADYFDKALALDPLGTYVLALYGWHKLQTGDLQAARKYFEDSFKLRWWDNEFAKGYLDLVERRLAEQQLAR